MIIGQRFETIPTHEAPGGDAESDTAGPRPTLNEDGARG